MPSRREFIKHSCVACLGLSTLGVLLDSCATSQMILKPTIDRHTMSVPLNTFQTKNSILLRNKDLEYDILVVKHEDRYTAMQMRCTHNDVALTFSGKKLICNAHGSEFDLDGNVIREPAAKSLTLYRTEINESDLIIYLKG